MTPGKSVIIFLCVCLPIQVIHAESAPVIAVAANFAATADTLGKEFTQHTGKSVRLSVAASGTLVHQIIEGAPFQLFLSADESYVNQLYKRGLTPDTGKIYAVGVLVLYVPATSHLDYSMDTKSILQQLVTNTSYKIALANPKLAPYGKAAQQVLNRFTSTQKLQGREIFGENVGQTAQFALADTIDAALLPLSIAMSVTVQQAGHIKKIPDDWYQPLLQRVVLINNAGTTARDFFQFLDSKQARHIIEQAGYGLPMDN